MSYPHRPGSGAGLPAVSGTESGRWTARRTATPRPITRVPMRRYEIMALTHNGEMIDEVRAAPATFARDADPQQTGGTKILIVLGWKASLPVDFGGTGGKFRLRKGPRLRTELRLEFGQPPAVRIEDRAVLRLRVGP